MKRYWSANVIKKSNALDLEEGIFRSNDPEEIATSLKKSAETSTRRKGSPFQSAMSMLNFYINRAGKNIDPKQRQTLEETKDCLRKLFNRK